MACPIYKNNVNLYTTNATYATETAYPLGAPEYIHGV